MRRVIKDFFAGFGNLFRKPRNAVYPKEKIIIPEGSRGIPKFRLDLDSLEIICNGCGDCRKACPENCIEIKKTAGEGGREVLDEFYLDLSKCIFCGNCVEVCSLDAIEMTYRHQLAETGKKSFRLEKLDLIKQSDYSLRDFWTK
ncbi:MAG: 4Fe-4S dicluster domain-containing protein [Actinobacteria bacterium]|nr:4Fe-4S dicluster domain-containing protein [Actinomycetota bacterium]